MQKGLMRIAGDVIVLILSFHLWDDCEIDDWENGSPSYGYRVKPECLYFPICRI